MVELQRQHEIELRETVRKSVAAGENVIWSGRPANKVFRQLDFIQVPFSMLWMSGVCFTAFMALSIGVPAPFYMVIAIFVCVGLYISFFQYLLEYLYLKNCVFVLTEKKAYIISSFPTNKTETIDIDSNTRVIAVQKDGRVNAVFFVDLPDWRITHRANAFAFQSSPKQTPCFFHLDESASPALDYLKEKTNFTTRPLMHIFGGYGGNCETSIAAASKTANTISVVPSTISKSEFELLPGESLLWHSTPEGGFRFRKSDIVAIPVIVLISAAMGLPAYLAISTIGGADGMAALLLVGIIISLMVIMSIAEVFLKKGTKYAITDRRVLARWNQGLGVVRHYALDLTQIHHVDCSSGTDDVGTIVFNQKDNLAVRAFGAEGIVLDPVATHRTEPFLLDIPKAKSVARLIEQQRTASRARQTSSLSSTQSNLSPPSNLSSTPSNSRDSVRRTPQKMTNRTLPQGLAMRMMFLSDAAKVPAIIASITLFIGCTHYFGYGGGQLQDLLMNGHLPKTGMPSFMFLIPCALIAVGVAVIAKHIMRTQAKIQVLKDGVATTGTYITEAVICQTNGHPSSVERCYEFFDADGVKFLAKSTVGAKHPLKREVTILYDVLKPEVSVVLEDLPRELMLTEAGSLKLKQQSK